MTFGAPRHHYRVTDSTNDRARELAEAGAPSGMVVTADEQRAGRGRHGRRWIAPPGTALLYSAVLRPLTEAHGLLPLAVPIAVCEAIESIAPVPAAIKWPNDVWIREQKVAGVLIEARPPDWAVIGIGVNLATGPAALEGDLRWPATSVGHGATQGTMRAAVDAALGRWVDADPERVLDAYRRRDALAGREVTWEEQGTTRAGTAAGVDERGNLVVALGGDRRVTLGAGDVSLRLG